MQIYHGSINKVKNPNADRGRNSTDFGKVLVAMGIILLIGFITLGFFAFPIGIPICAVVGLTYGIKNRDRLFTKWSVVALLIGIACIVYTLWVIKSM